MTSTLAVASPPLDGAPAAPASASAPDGACYHCGEPLPAGQRFDVSIKGTRRAMCCAGCAAVAQAIVENGLASYYEQREQWPAQGASLRRSSLPELEIFDRENIQRDFVSPVGEHESEAALILEGISCPACVWLNEAHLAQQPGVVAVNVNYTTRRARVRWDTRKTRLSALLSAIEAIGYRAYPYDPAAMEQSRDRERRDALLRLAVAGLGMMQVMMYAFPAYVAGAEGLAGDAAALMRWASLVLTFPVVAYSSLPFFRGAVRDLRRGRVGMDVPVALGIGAAFGASVAATLTGSGEVYFDSVAMFVFFLLGGRFLELRARHRAAEYLEYLARAMPAVALRLGAGDAAEDAEPVPAGALEVGDRVLVRPGDTFPADGVIAAGETAVDESLLTGESLPLAKQTGDAVVGGAVNRGHPVKVRITRVGAETTLSGIVRLMARAEADKPRIQQVTERVATRFVALVLLTAAVTGLYWLWADPARALAVVVAVLVVSCPCALSLATPTALAIASAAMARLGIVVTRGQAIETLASATHFVFDKTGTLTQGRLEVVEVRPFGEANPERALALAAALERQSEHPLAKAVVAAAPAAGSTVPVATEVRSHAGRGVEGVVEGRPVRIGQRLFVAELAPRAPRIVAEPAASTAVWIGDDRGMLGRILFADRLRADAPALVADLQRAGLATILLSGDGERPVRDAARLAGVPTWQARMSPDQKLEAVRELQAHDATVAMVGDGVNDVPVLAQAQVSIAMGAGAALAQGAADMVLMSPRLADVARGYRLSRKTVRVIRGNLAWAFAYNAVMLPLAAAGFVTPWLAGIGMSLSSLLVVLNALRVRNLVPAAPRI